MHKYRSPLSVEEIDHLADAVDDGNGVPAELSSSDVAAILGIVIRRRERSRVAALLIQADLNDDQALRDRLASRERERRTWRVRGLPGLAPPDDIVIDLLTSPEGLALINLLAGMVSLSVSMATGTKMACSVGVVSAVFPSVPVGMMVGYGARPQAQALYLAQYLRQKTLGDPVIDRGVVVGRSAPATVCHPHGQRLRPALRAWANSLDPAAALVWLDAGQVLRHFDDIEEAGAQALAVFGRPFDRLGIPLDGMQPGRPLSLPIGAAPLLPAETEQVGLPPEFTPDDEAGSKLQGRSGLRRKG